MFGRTSGFGTQSNTFGFGGTSTNTFGQPNQLFGSNPGGFNTSAPVFGTGTQPMFGSTPSSATPLFGASNTSTFGQPNQSGFGRNGRCCRPVDLLVDGITFGTEIEYIEDKASKVVLSSSKYSRYYPTGSTLFGSGNQASSSGIFGSASTSTFGQQNKPPGFGFPSSSGGGLFSQNSQPNQQNAPSVFQSASSTGLFGSTNTFGSNATQLGTVIKFVPVTGTDSVQKSGIVQSINTKHHCITCMKEYEGKSLEELRYEDYQCNRKGPQPPPPFVQPQPFGIASTSSSIFGQPDKPTFGAPRTDFGTSGFGMSTQTTTANIFGKPTTGFGTPTSSAFPFATNTSTSGLFGSNTGPKPFATPSNQMFGTSQPQQNTFGNAFSQTTTQNAGGIFGKPANSGFNTSQSGFTFGTPQQNQTSLFQTSKPNTGFGIFGQSNMQTPAFGQQQTQSTFGLNSTFGKPVQPFGQPSQSTFGGNQSIFGNAQSKPLFGNTMGGSLFGNTFQQSTPFQLNTQQQQQTATLGQLENQAQELRALVHLTDPYGYNKHLEGLSPIKPATAAYVTNPKDLQKLLESPPPIAVVSPMNKRLQVLPISVKKSNLFEDMLDRETEINFKLRTSAKRLVINKEHQGQKEDESPQIQLDIQDTIDSHVVPNITLQEANKLDITPIDKYKEQTQGQPQDSISSLMTINTNLMKETLPTDPPLSTSSTPPLLNQDAQISTRIDEHEQGDVIEKPIDSCGVKLTRPEYYTIPPLEKLIEHKQSDGQCLVKGFTIGRVAYGNVCFPDLMDISNLDLDELVFFRYREVTVYPDDSKKPAEGQGLNRRAQITLDRVYPKSKTDRKLITNTDTLISINFSDTLRDLCEKHGTKFLDYRPETGSWVFMVDHFSKYGFSESDDEECHTKIAENGQTATEAKELERSTKKNQQKLKEELVSKEARKLKEEKLLKSKLLMEVEFERDMECAKMIVDEDMFDVDMGIDEDSLGPHGASIENLDFDYNNIPETSALHHIQSRRNLYQCSPRDIFFMKASLYEDENFVPVNIEDHDIETITAESALFRKRPAPAQEISKPVRQYLKLKPKIFALQNNTSIFVDQAIYNERNYMDIAVFKGASFKARWGRGTVLTTKVSSNSDLPRTGIDQGNSLIKIVDVSGLQEFDPFMDKLEQHLQVVLDTSDILMEPNNIPLFTIRPSRAALLRHQLLARETAKDHIGNMAVAYYQQIWDLCAAFWGPMSPPTNRRDLFSTWLENAVELDVEEELASLDDDRQDSVFLQIFVNLTGDRISEAAEIAADAGLYNLSLLISELNASRKTKLLMGQQLDYWKSSLTFKHIHPTLQKIYMLLAGQSVGGSTNQCPLEPINICDNLDWKRCLAVMLWYIASSADDISTALELYREDFEDTGFSIRPIPPHCNGENVFDLLYHLMLLHCGKGKSLETILEPETHSFLLMDYRLSWLLLHTLQSLQIGIIGVAAKTFMTISFSEQLESLGLYKWAVFVLLFIEDINLRKNYIMGVLHRNLLQDDTDRLIEDEIVVELCVPCDWIHEVKAYKSDILSMHWEAYKHFTYTGHWVSSHEVAMTYVIPQLIVNDQFDMAGYVLRDMEPGCRSILNWPDEGGLLLMFLDLYDKFQEKQKFGREEALSIHSLLIRVCIGITKFPATSAAQVAALSQISKYCNIYGKLLENQMQPIHTGTMQITSLQLDELIMPPDYKGDDLHKEGSSNTNSDQDDDYSLSLI